MGFIFWTKGSTAPATEMSSQEVGSSSEAATSSTNDVAASSPEAVIAAPAAETAATALLPKVKDIPLGPVDDISHEPAKEMAASPPPVRPRRFSLKRLSFSTPHEPRTHKAAESVVEERTKESRAAAAAHHVKQKAPSASEKRTQRNALALRTMMVGRGSATLKGQSTVGGVAKPDLGKIKKQLMEPRSANKLIAQLRSLPVSDREGGRSQCIHAVCLELTEEEADAKHFGHLEKSENVSDVPSDSPPSASTTTANSINSAFDEMHIVSLITSPDLGIGQPGDGNGLLAGALPTPETVIQGIKQITPQLMKLGYVVGNSVLPDHTGVYPPTDRLSVLTYWWGLEIVLPPPTLVYLANAHSISTSIMNVLSALAMVNNGVREILPFVRYISQFIDFEFSSIQRMNNGDGVVCAATWIMPAALVPRPWDFEAPPPPPPNPTTEEGKVPTHPPTFQEEKQALQTVSEEPTISFPMPVPAPAATDDFDIVLSAPDLPIASPLSPVSSSPQLPSHSISSAPFSSPSMGGLASSPLRHV